MEAAVKLNNKCRYNHWTISWGSPKAFFIAEINWLAHLFLFRLQVDREDNDVAPDKKWTAYAIINGREYARGQGSKKGRARDAAAVKALNVFGEDSIARLEDWIARHHWSLRWENLPCALSPTALVWTATALVNEIPYGRGYSTFYICAQEEAAKQALDRLIETLLEVG